MIDIEDAKKKLNRYVEVYNIEDERIKLKLEHTLRTMDVSMEIATKMNLSREDVNLATLIGLLHDIGRFEQVAKYGTFNDALSIDHGEYGAKILFGSGFIREFIEDDTYDDIIRKSIIYHNKYKVPDTLNAAELLHTNIIRDADKIDNFYLKLTQDFKNLFEYDTISNEIISDEVLNEFLSCSAILNEVATSNLDNWVKYLAWIFDINFNESFEIIKREDYINRLIDRIDYKKQDTIDKMSIIKNAANKYLAEK